MNGEHSKSQVVSSNPDFYQVQKAANSPTDCGCDACARWTIVYREYGDTEETELGQSWQGSVGKETAEDVCSLMNMAYEQALELLPPDETSEVNRLRKALDQLRAPEFDNQSARFNRITKVLYLPSSPEEPSAPRESDWHCTHCGRDNDPAESHCGHCEWSRKHTIAGVLHERECMGNPCRCGAVNGSDKQVMEYELLAAARSELPDPDFIPDPECEDRVRRLRERIDAYLSVTDYMKLRASNDKSDI